MVVLVLGGAGCLLAALAFLGEQLLERQRRGVHVDLQRLAVLQAGGELRERVREPLAVVGVEHQRVDGLAFEVADVRAVAADEQPVGVDRGDVEQCGGVLAGTEASWAAQCQRTMSASSLPICSPPASET